MPHKIPLAVASLAAALTFAVALAVAGITPRTQVTATTTAATATDQVAVADPPTVQIDTIYVAAPPAQQTITVHKVVKRSGDDGSENESGGDD